MNNQLYARIHLCCVSLFVGTFMGYLIKGDKTMAFYSVCALAWSHLFYLWHKNRINQ